MENITLLVNAGVYLTVLAELVETFLSFMELEICAVFFKLMHDFSITQLCNVFQLI